MSACTFNMKSVSRKCLRISLAVTLALIVVIYTLPTIRLKVSPTQTHTLGGQYLRARTSEVFSDIYNINWWGTDDSETPFFSGTGSHDAEAVDPYVAAIRSFIEKTFSSPPDVADLGCGDFNVGRQIRDITGHYAACDIAEDLIDYNKKIYADEKVDFRVVDIISEELPAADVVFVRQVLQHLDNESIAFVIPKLYQYKWAVITEHLPFDEYFVPNLDIFTGDVRLVVDSGVDVTKHPFNFKHRGATVLSETLAKDGRIRTTAFKI